MPEASTLGRFRTRLGDRLDDILAEIVAMLEEARVILAEGRIAIVDATVVEAARSGLHTGDPEAGSAVKVTVKGRRRAVWGWQAFVNADEDCFIRRTAVSPGNAAEIHSLNELVIGDEAALYAPFRDIALRCPVGQWIPPISAPGCGPFWSLRAWSIRCSGVAATGAD